MAINVNRLSRLSREKTTGNILIIVAALLSTAFLYSLITTKMDTLTDRILIFVLVGIFFVFGYIINLRQPFFTEVSKYVEELNNRRINIAQILVSADMIDSFQLLSEVETVLTQVEVFQSTISEHYQESKSEILINAHPFQSEEVQSLLQLIILAAEEALTEIDKKRSYIIMLAKTRNHLLNTINRKLTRPKNEVEFDYLFYKLKKDLPEVYVDTQLLHEIVIHALTNGEIHGKLKKDNFGEELLVIGKEQLNISQTAYMWGNSSTTIEYCVICRQSIVTYEDEISCPKCQNTFHRTHLLEWLKVFNQCPMCQEKISPLPE
ncbi:MAG: RING finger protein [Candidatus Hodarchaeales archaeon]|jgi:hypothetical protein